MSRTHGRTGSVVAAAAAVLLVALAGCSDDADAPTPTLADCVPAVDEVSRARTWNEALLDAIRLDVPAPTVHARNLFHTSAAMWDAWAAYDPTAVGVFVDEDLEADDVDAARAVAMSFAAYRVLVERYLLSAGAEEAVTGFDHLMDDLCLDRSFTDEEGDEPAAVGNRIAATILSATLDDGSNEAERYANPDYQPVNPPLPVATSGATMDDPNRWQPLEIEGMVAQNGMPLDQTVQTYVGSQWGDVTPFALDRLGGGWKALDPGPPPRLGDPASDETFKAAAAEVVAYSARLDPTSGETIDISPATQGNTPLGTYDSAGWDENPETGEPYEPNVVALGDYGRVVAEFWADGPRSETPPGHWNTVANSVTDALEGDLRFEGDGPTLDPLEWDVKLYLALNGAMHDSAVAAWGLKADYDSARPISMIRYLGGLGQSTDPAGPSYDPAGLPLVDDLIEVVTEASSAPGQRHEELADHVGDVTVRAWQGASPDPETVLSGVGWILAADWMPYQLPTFVTPAFAAFVSGHSTYSRAGAEVLTAITGSEYFPGGLAETTVSADSLDFDAGPDEDITLQWATYADASDQAGISRLYGGIHIRADDLRGREVGAEAGHLAWELAHDHFDGTVED